MNILKSMEIQSGHSELSVISQVSAVEGCPLSGVPLYILLSFIKIVVCKSNSLLETQQSSSASSIQCCQRLGFYPNIRIFEHNFASLAYAN